MWFTTLKAAVNVLRCHLKVCFINMSQKKHKPALGWWMKLGSPAWVHKEISVVINTAKQPSVRYTSQFCVLDVLVPCSSFIHLRSYSSQLSLHLDTVSHNQAFWEMALKLTNSFLPNHSHRSQFPPHENSNWTPGYVMPLHTLSRIQDLTQGTVQSCRPTNGVSDNSKWCHSAGTSSNHGWGFQLAP